MLLGKLFSQWRGSRAESIIMPNLFHSSTWTSVNVKPFSPSAPTLPCPKYFPHLSVLKELFAGFTQHQISFPEFMNCLKNVPDFPGHPVFQGDLSGSLCFIMSPQETQPLWQTVTFTIHILCVSLTRTIHFQSGIENVWYYNFKFQ